GMMGAGKTTVERMLARRLKLRFVDSDHEIEERCGVKIPVIFEIEGEAGFRAREAQAIAELVRLDGIVLATGGGVVLAAENRRLLAERGTVVIGGIFEENDRTDVTKVPLLGDIPILGYLFKNTTSTTSKTELLVFITPRVVNERLTIR
ncbi:MAG TPA: shikimate kinase, partial [Burkholderiales bacterium]|nr:shikimate kinase [Burkholderiales bacterium]